MISAIRACQMLGIPQSTFASWVLTELIKPEKLGIGRSSTILSTNDFIDMNLIKYLKAKGFSTQKCRWVLERIQTADGYREAGAVDYRVHSDYFLTDGRGIFLKVEKHFVLHEGLICVNWGDLCKFCLDIIAAEKRVSKYIDIYL